MFLLLWPCRRLGWFVSRKFLFMTPMLFGAIVGALWGIAAAYLVGRLINAWHPWWPARIFMGYMAGAYISDPAFGLSFADVRAYDSIRICSLVSFLLFIVCCLLFGFGVIRI
jgi:hypothetical protein